MPLTECFCTIRPFFYSATLILYCQAIFDQIEAFYLEHSKSIPCMLSDEVKNVDYASFRQQRITELRMKRNVSEYQMSLELGQNKNYIQGISSGKALPSMTQFFNICDYFCITPEQFFSDHDRPELIDAISEGIQELSDADLELLLLFIRRLQRNI